MRAAGGCCHPAVEITAPEINIGAVKLLFFYRCINAISFILWKMVVHVIDLVDRVIHTAGGKFFFRHPLQVGKQHIWVGK